MRAIVITLLFVLVGVEDSWGSVTSTMFAGSTNASFDDVADSANSSSASDAITALATANNSSTQSDLSWDWDGSILTGTGLVAEEKFLSARPGGDHLGDVSLTFDFTVDVATDYSLDGTWGFDNASPGGDTIMLSLAGSGGFSVSDSTVSNTGIASDNFSLSGTLDPGSYTFMISAELAETINNELLSLAGWQLSSFKLKPSDAGGTLAVPEPHSTFAFMALTALLVQRRKRPR